MPAGQSTHAKEVFAPRTEACVPAAQLMQADEPGTSEYVPAPHRKHPVSSCTEEYVPAAQLLQADAPWMLENVPALHAWQVHGPPRES